MTDKSMYRDTPRARYERDPDFRSLVSYMSYMWAMIERAQFSPSELREAEMLAAIMYEERRTIRHVVARDGGLEPKE